MNNDQPKIDFNQIPKHQVEALCRTLLKSCAEFYSDPKNVEKYEQGKAQRDKNEEKDV